MRTFSPKSEDFKETWYLVDAEDETLGRLAARVARVLRGKHLPTFSPHISPRTHVIIVNADKVRLTGKKWTDKIYYWHTDWPNGLRSTTPQKLIEKKPTELIRRAVWGMIPKNRLGHATMTRLKIYAGPEHPHKAQQPEVLTLHTNKAKEVKA
ncbi:MAG TPA: 50S ribosomal protein L13 [Candidatus Sumerlaeota bacterium]|nr:MAG: 50S ribosomal protein L13 [candidate division BRC1 bacterium ADurb.Bin183]HOE63267.1 50S ribosomal protein L13 [Candidatus Sumerlaeota bacterium]HRR29855.1 50S ribosomal protein L13 [Candidatus Sumerlaeia bacterium]HON50625.1 50S ribosomal protein L13 [Candidatus Sumerlaeota bacterium]HOR65447.1 50S ribosomal protein L13 [Candidatus Sumerlaeota bacterium]